MYLLVFFCCYSVRFFKDLEDILVEFGKLIVKLDNGSLWGGRRE